MLTAGFSIPGCLPEAEALKKEHEQFQTAIEKTHASAVHVRQHAETLLTNNHYDPKAQFFRAPCLRLGRGQDRPALLNVRHLAG